MTDHHTFTSESVTEGHPDKMADQISDAVLDAVLDADPRGRVACETLLTTGLVVVAGEVTTSCYVDIARLVRDVVCDIGYDHEGNGFNGRTCGVMVALDEQSPDIAQGVDAAHEVRSGSDGEDQLNAQGAGDQGMMFGYACDETPDLMPVPIWLAHRLAQRLVQVRRVGVLPYLRPDGKTQVSVIYSDGRPVALDTILVSTQHAPGVDIETLLLPDLSEHVIHPLLPPDLDASSWEARTRIRGSPVARSSWTPTAGWPVMVEGRSRVKTLRRWTVLLPMQPAGWPSTWWRPELPDVASCKSPTRSESHTRCR